MLPPDIQPEAEDTADAYVLMVNSGLELPESPKTGKGWVKIFNIHQELLLTNDRIILSGGEISRDQDLH